MGRYRLLMLACVLMAAVAVPVALLHRDGSADAEALVIAERLEVGPQALPRYGQAVFADGQVARAVAATHGGQATEVVPDRVSLAAEPDSVVFRVIGHGTDAERAAEIANTAAEAFVSALNQSGAGVGQFVLQQRADPDSATQFVDGDTASADTGSPDQTVLAALLGGGLLAVGLAVGLVVGWALGSRADRTAGSR